MKKEDIEHIKTMVTQAYEAANHAYGELKAAWRRWDSKLEDIEVPKDASKRVNDLRNKTCKQIYD